jgi:hypothetical protein
MKKIIIILLVTLVATAVGLYYRPSFALIGQLDWWNVLTKGYFVGTFSALFSQSLIDESFWFVMRFTGGGVVAGILLTMLGGKSGGKSSGKKKK